MMRDVLNHGLARTLSLLLALGLSILILVYPQFLITEDGATHHGLMMVLLASISVGFIHGVGFAPARPLWQIALSPLVAWPPMMAGLVWFLVE